STLEVSRTTIREAIQRLAALGYVDVRRGRTGGAYVLEATGPGATEMIRRTLLPEWHNMEDLLEFRQMIEPLIARTAARRMTRARAVKDHTALAAAVIDGRATAAARIAARHFELTEAVLRDLVSTIEGGET